MKHNVVQFDNNTPAFTMNLLYLIKKTNPKIESNVSEPGASKLLSLTSRYRRYTLTRYGPKEPRELKNSPCTTACVRSINTSVFKIEKLINLMSVMQNNT